MQMKGGCGHKENGSVAADCRLRGARKKAVLESNLSSARGETWHRFSPNTLLHMKNIHSVLTSTLFYSASHYGGREESAVMEIRLCVYYFYSPSVSRDTR